MKTAENSIMVFAITLEAALGSHDLPTVVKHVAEDLRSLALAAVDATGAQGGAGEAGVGNPPACTEDEHFWPGAAPSIGSPCGCGAIAWPMENVAEAELLRVSELLVTHFGETTRTSVSEHLTDVISQQSNEGPSDGEMLEWAMNNVIFSLRVGPIHRIAWPSDAFDPNVTEGTDWRDAITKAMRECAAIGQTSEAAR